MNNLLTEKLEKINHIFWKLANGWSASTCKAENKNPVTEFLNKKVSTIDDDPDAPPEIVDVVLSEGNGWFLVLKSSYGRPYIKICGSFGKIDDRGFQCKNYGGDLKSPKERSAAIKIIEKLGLTSEKGLCSLFQSLLPGHSAKHIDSRAVLDIASE